MKEAFWGVLIVLLGLFGIVVVNIFQNVTVDNDRVYYLIKESTEASAFDALDLSYYRLSGKLRIVEDKFVENLTRRFSENVTLGDYTIIVEDLNELPPKISLRVRSGVTSLRGEEFGIVNRVDAILETKYSLEEVLEYLDMTEEEWGKEVKIESDGDSNVCNSTINDEEMDCIPGDIKFEGFESANTQNAVCQDETPNANVGRKAKYKVCNCGKWEDKEEMVYANPVNTATDWAYTWTFNKTGEIRNISETIKTKVPKQICTTAIEIMVPKKIDETMKCPVYSDNNSNSGSVCPEANLSLKDKLYEPSQDNSEYMLCPTGGIKIPLGLKFVMHPNYIPPNSINRELTWETTDSSVLGITVPNDNPGIGCQLNGSYSNCFSKATINAKKVGVALVKVTTTRNQTATCKVEVYDGTIDELSCEDMTLEIGADDKDKGVILYDYSPKNANKMNFTFSIDNTGNEVTIAEITGNQVKAKVGGTAKIVVKDTVTGKTASCQLKVKAKIKDNEDSDGGSSDNPEFYYSITYKKDGVEYRECCYGSKKQADAEAKKIADKNKGTTISINHNDFDGHGEIQVDTEKTNTGDGGSKGKGSKSSTEKKVEKASKTSEPVAFCLDKNTKVLTLDGYKDISEIKVGDKVLSYNYEKKINEFKTVLTVYKHKNVYDTLYSFVVNNKIVKATRLHQFYVKINDGYKYVKAEKLKIGDLLMDSNGNYHAIRKISSEFKLSNYYDLEVEDNHNFYIGRDNILVHNAPTK